MRLGWVGLGLVGLQQRGGFCVRDECGYDKVRLHTDLSCGLEYVLTFLSFENMDHCVWPSVVLGLLETCVDQPEIGTTTESKNDLQEVVRVYANSNETIDP